MIEPAEVLSVFPSQAGDGMPDYRTYLQVCAQEAYTALRATGSQPRHALSDRSVYVHSDALEWLSAVPRCSIHAIVTDPPYGLIEYDQEHLEKLRNGGAGVWRIPPSFDGNKRSPLPRFTVLSESEVKRLYNFFSAFAYCSLRALVPGAHVFVASNPLLSSITFHALQRAGLEKRGEVIRLVQTLRGGDRPKGAEHEFPEVSVMPRSCWEPWGVFRKPMDGTVADCLRRWGTGALRRPSPSEPLKDVIPCSPARGLEKQIAPHPTLKPQRFLRKLVRASLPLGIGIVYDPFCGSGSTLAAAERLGYYSVGTDRDEEYVRMGCEAFQRLVDIEVTG